MVSLPRFLQKYLYPLEGQPSLEDVNTFAVVDGQQIKVASDPKKSYPQLVEQSESEEHGFGCVGLRLGDWLCSWVVGFELL